MKSITSKDNSTYKSALKLTKRKYRDESGKYLIEGPKPIQDAVNAGLELDCIFVRETAVNEALPSEAISLSGDLFDKLSDTQTSQGVIAVANKNVIRPEDLEMLLNSGSVNKALLVLDRLQDPGNVGTIIRTAEAAGMAAVLVMPGTCDIYSPKVTRAAAGSIMRIPIIYMDDEEAVLELLHNLKLKLAVSALEGADEYGQTDLTECGIVIGNEGQGVSEKFIALADKKVKIPMMGEIESLNAAVAAGILMYAAGKVK